MKPRKSFSLITILFILIGFTELAQAFYNPETGSFLSRDPIEERGGENLYGFVRNDGVNGWDVLGKIPATLSANQIDNPDPGFCGEVKWLIQFIVSPNNSEVDLGIVLQEVKYDGWHEKYDQNGFMEGKREEIGPDTNPYHEVWDAGDLDIGADKFSYSGNGNRSKGELTITGWARYYPNLSFSEKVGTPGDSEFEDIGWTNQRSSNGTWATDGQWAGARNPGWLAAGATASNLYQHKIKIKWNCCENFTETEILETTF